MVVFSCLSSYLMFTKSSGSLVTTLCVDQYANNTKPVAVETLGEWVAKGAKLGSPDENEASEGWSRSRCVGWSLSLAIWGGGK